MDLYPVTDDGVRLAATLHLPETGGPFPCVVALHAAAFGTRAHPLYQHLAISLGAVGISVCVYDRRGEGESDGTAEAPLERLAADGRTVIDALRERPEVDAEKVGVWGISQGGWLGPLAAGVDDAIAFVIAVSASGVSPSAQMHFAMENVLRERGFGDADIAAAHAARAGIETAYRDGNPTEALSTIEAAQHERWFPSAYLPTVEDVSQPDAFEIDLDAAGAFARVRVATLAIYGAWDRWVPVAASIEVWRVAFSDRPEMLTIERIEDVGHMMTTPDDPADLDEQGPISPAYGDAMTSWLHRLNS